MSTARGHTLAGTRENGFTRTIRVFDPATGDHVSEVDPASSADVDAAVALAHAAGADWARRPSAERASAVARAAARVRADADALASLSTAEMGRPAALAQGGVEAAAATMSQYAELGPLHRGRSLQGARDATDLMVHEPRGVVAVITPWNDPVAVPAGLLAAALVTGNTVVFKPSERTPSTGGRLADSFAAELPPGVLQVVQGDGGTGALLAGHDDVDVVCHVGSTAAGRAIAQAAARTGAKVVLENGGNDPLIVDADVDPAWAAAQAALGGFINSGQLCTSVERVHVHQAVAQEFLAALVDEAEALVMGPGSDPRTTLGPMVDERARAAVHTQVRQAADMGARVLTGGEVPAGVGAFYPATVLADARPDMAVMAEETFGPVIPVMTATSFEDALQAAAQSPYGLAATVLTGSMVNAQEAWRRLPVGTVKVNAVFGGAPGGAAQPRGASGEGFGYGPELLDELTLVKVVHMGRPTMRGDGG
jgi:succinate-semialdehyde dehydrogenase / glutarate-semialdehyde dehydrogenase